MLVIVGGWAAAGPPLAGEPAAQPEPAALVSGDARAAALQDYATRAARLRRHALASGTVTYHEVVACAYGPGVIDERILAAKARWRTTNHPDCVFISDYAAVSAWAAVEALVPVPDPGLHSTLVAQYESVSNVIALATAAADFAIFHETGHRLQRAALQMRGGAAGRQDSGSPGSLETASPSRTVDPTAARRLAYLSSQYEFEVRLQDLNRFYALLVAGRPILDPIDSVRALVALGVPVHESEARDAFRVTGATLTPEQSAELAGTAVVPATLSAVPFEDARELILMRRLSLRVDPGCWQRLLTKIILEAPGHL